MGTRKNQRNEGFIYSHDQTLEIREKETEDKDLEEEASVGNFFTSEKRGIENFNVPNVKK